MVMHSFELRSGAGWLSSFLIAFLVCALSAKCRGPPPRTVPSPVILRRAKGPVPQINFAGDLDTRRRCHRSSSRPSFSPPPLHTNTTHAQHNNAAATSISPKMDHTCAQINHGRRLVSRFARPCFSDVVSGVRRALKKHCSLRTRFRRVVPSTSQSNVPAAAACDALR